jgi:simple sugar transport system permease protein
MAKANAAGANRNGKAARRGQLSQRVVSGVILVLAVAMIAVGVYGVNLRGGAEGTAFLTEMRVRAVLATTGEGAVEAYVEAAKDVARAKVKAEGGGMKATVEAVNKAEEQARAEAKNSLVDYATVDTVPLNAAIDQVELSSRDYRVEESRAKAAYIEAKRAEMEEKAAEEAAAAAPVDAEGSLAEPAMDDLGTEVEVDMTGFTETPEMQARYAAIDTDYVLLTAQLNKIYAGTDENSFTALKKIVIDLIYQDGDTYTTQFDRFAASGGQGALGDSLTKARIIRYGDDMLTVGVALILLGIALFFWGALCKALGIPRLIIGLFFVLLCVLSVLYDLSFTTLMSNTIVRMGMNSVLVLAMVPAIQSGISLNLGLPIGIIGGLIGGLMCIEFNMSGWSGFLFAIAVGIVIAAVLGYLYGLLLNRLKGNEMAVTTYVGYSVVSLMCIAWLVLPFKSLVLRWPLGTGLRMTSGLTKYFKHILNDLWAFDIGGVTIPTGLILFMALCCFLVFLFMRSKTGIAMQAGGNNPRFAEASGINVDRTRVIGTILSTVLGAVGILVYSQSFGFMQLYNAPRQMGFVAASAILIGGASTTRARISHVLIGTFLFQGVLTLGMPVANALVPQSTISETMRILISNGIILYALTKSGGASRA